MSVDTTPLNFLLCLLMSLENVLSSSEFIISLVAATTCVVETSTTDVLETDSQLSTPSIPFAPYVLYNTGWGDISQHHT